MVNVAFELGNQVNEELEYSKNLDSINYDCLLIMGMGGSGVAGDVYNLLSNETTSKNVIVRKTYSIPQKLISKKPFCLFISYSGNTEETISGINDAISNELDWAVISSGGKLISYAEKHKKPYIKIPKGLQPRAAFGYLTQAVCKYIDLVENTNYLDEIQSAGEYLNNILEEKENAEIYINSKELAKKINKKTCVIYGGTPLTELVSGRWKTQINENAKSKAYVGSMPEVHHNEILSWDADPASSKNDYVLIFLRDSEEHPQIKKRFELTEKLLGDKVDIYNIETKTSDSLLKKLMELVLFGDLFSISLSDELGMIPEDIEGIENLKEMLGE